MALSRRTGQRFQASIWPGFVDAMTGLLLVLFFVLSIFMVVQFTLRETITGQESELDELSREVSALARALGLEEERGADLQQRVGLLNSTLSDARQEADRQSALIASLTAERDQTAAALDAARTQITSFEAQVAALISERDTALGTVETLEGTQAELLSEQEALNLALAQARAEIDEGTETARLAAARREALEALIADLRVRNSEAEAVAAELTADLSAARTALSDEEAARLAEAAAAEALRARLESADSELTAMTLALEEQRRKAEETLTLLAAAEAAESDLDDKLIAALLSVEALEREASALGGEKDRLGNTVQQLETDRAVLQAEIDALEGELSAATGAADTANTDLAALRTALAAAEARLSDSQSAAQSAQAEAAALRTRVAETEAQLQAATDAANVDQSTLRDQLRAALAARLAAETLAEDQTTEAQKQAALLETAKSRLAEEEEISLEAQRQAAVLNQQVGALRTQLGELQALLDDAKSRDVAKDVQLQSLGSELNTALARVAAEEGRRRQLEEDERARLEAEAKALQEQTKDLARYRSEFFGQLRDLLGTQDGVQIVGDRFVFSSEVLFAPGQADLSAEGRAQISRIAEILRNVSSDIPAEIDWVLQVDGHTDNIPLSGFGQYADNWELSQARALSVVRYMVSSLGLPPDRLSANGFGEFQPLNTADTDAARAQNRRIEIKFTEK